MELPVPPAWYSVTTQSTPPPPVPLDDGFDEGSVAKVRAFGRPPFDDAVPAEGREVAAVCASLKEANRELMRKFVQVLRASSSAEFELTPQFAALDAKLAELHAGIAELRVHEARANLAAHYRAQTAQRVECAKRIRRHTAAVAAAVPSVLAGEDDDPVLPQ